MDRERVASDRHLDDLVLADSVGLLDPGPVADRVEGVQHRAGLPDGGEVVEGGLERLQQGVVQLVDLVLEHLEVCAELLVADVQALPAAGLDVADQLVVLGRHLGDLVLVLVADPLWRRIRLLRLLLGSAAAAYAAAAAAPAAAAAAAAGAGGASAAGADAAAAAPVSRPGGRGGAAEGAEELGVGVADLHEVLAPDDEGGEGAEQLVHGDILQLDAEQALVAKQAELEGALEARAHAVSTKISKF